MKEALAVADEKVAAAQTEAEDAKEKADLTETESLFFLGEMQVAVAEAEKKIVALHKTVASRDMKLAQVTGEVKALKTAVREREAKLESAESDYKAKLEAELATLKKAHAEDLESAKGEVEGQSVMLEMENEQLLKNIDDKRAKIKALQGELGRAAEKHKQLREQSEMAKARAPSPKRAVPRLSTRAMNSQNDSSRFRIRTVANLPRRCTGFRPRISGMSSRRRGVAPSRSDTRCGSTVFDLEISTGTPLRSWKNSWANPRWPPRLSRRRPRARYWR